MKTKNQLIAFTKPDIYEFSTIIIKDPSNDSSWFDKLITSAHHRHSRWRLWGDI